MEEKCRGKERGETSKRKERAKGLVLTAAAAADASLMSSL